MRKVVSGAMLALLFLASLTPILSVKCNVLNWWDSAWSYRVPITITERSGNTLTDYQVLLEFDSASLIANGKLRTDAGDLRFITQEGDELQYWLESGVNTSSTKVWVKVPLIPSNGAKTIYMYYGNPDATTRSDFSIFPFSFVKTINFTEILPHEIIYTLAFAPSKEKKDWLLIGLMNDYYMDRNIPIYDIKQEKVVGNVTGYRPRGVTWSADATMIAVGGGGNDADVRIFETTNWTLVYTVPYPGYGYYDAYPSFKDDKYLAVIYGYNRKLRIYNCSDWSLAKEISDMGGDYPQFNPTGTKMAIAGNNQYVQVLNTSDNDAANWSVERTLQVPEGTTARLCWSMDGQELIVFTYEPCKIYIYDTFSWSVKKSTEWVGPVTENVACKLGIVATYWNISEARIYDHSTLSLVKTIGTGEPETGGGVGFNLQGNYLAMGYGKTVYLYKVREFTYPEPTAILGAEEEQDAIPPEISEPWQDPPANNVQPLQNVTVRVNVTDYGSGIKNVTLWYSIDNGTSWTILNMTELPIPSDTWITYEATIDGYGNCTWVTYKIIAYDNAGNNATKDNNGYGYQYHIIPEFPSTPILILLMLTTLIATTLWKTKRKHQTP